MAHRRKWLGGFCQDYANVEAGVSATTRVWRTYFHTGHGVSHIYVQMLLAVADVASPPAPLDPSVAVEVANPTTLVATDVFSRVINIVDSTLADAPDSFIDASGTLAVSDDTDYELRFTVLDNARIVSASAWEIGERPVNDATTGGVDPRYAMGDPILDGSVLSMAQGQTELLKTNRHHLLSWASYGESSIVNATSTYKNILDGSSTAVGAASPGWYIQNRYGNTRTTTTIPTVFAVFAEGTSNGGYAQFTDGTTALTTGVITTAGWYTVAGNVPADNATKYDVLAAGHAAGGSIRVDAVAVLEYS